MLLPLPVVVSAADVGAAQADLGCKAARDEADVDKTALPRPRLARGLATRRSEVFGDVLRVRVLVVM